MAPCSKRVPAVDERIEMMKKSLKAQKEKADEVVPGLTELLEKYLDDDPQVKPSVVEFLRDEVGRDFRPSASPASRQEMKEMESAHRVREFSIEDVLNGDLDHELSLWDKFKDRFSQFFGGEGESKAYEHAKFQNWGRTVETTPLYTFVPKKVSEIKAVVKFAKKKGMSIRCSGYRHSWAPVFAGQNQILISMLDLHRVDHLPDPTSLGFYDLFDHEDEPLESITFMDEGFNANDKRLVRVGAAVTNETFRRWCKKNDVTLPANVIMVEITLGGSNAPICHGAGLAHKTLSDIVRAIEYIDANGEKRKVKSRDNLRAAAGCFGLLGVVTHITFELDKLTIAKMEPLKLPAIFAVPPPEEYIKDMPTTMDTLMEPWKKLSDAEKKTKITDFERRCQDKYYSEFFWFVLSDYCWINAWNQTFDADEIKKATAYPSGPQIFLQFVETVLMNIAQNMKFINEFVRMFDFEQPVTTVISRLAMSQLPADEAILCPLPDALHFQRAVQNVRVRDLEVEMPLQPREDDPKKPDFMLVRKAWWDAILNVYQPKSLEAMPMNFPLEMRITGGSDMIMAPQRGNNFGTCSIEVLTLQNNKDIWEPFAQQVLDRWMIHTDAAGKRIKTRPHWAKEWACYKVDGRPWIRKLKDEDYKEEIAEFKSVLSEIGSKQGWTLSDLKSRFSNHTYNELIFS